MKIYIGHATAFDYQQKLYLPLKNSLLWQQHEFILPHEHQLEPVNTKKIISSVDLMIAEVSCPSTGLGIELGWAEQARRKILCLYQQQTVPSAALNIICNQFIAYTDAHHLIAELTNWLANQK